MILRLLLLLSGICIFKTGSAERGSLSENRNASVAIIGAGFAGLAAARRLRELGFTDVTIYEGSSKIGGRVRFQKLGDRYIQFGAEFVNGNQNPIYEIAQKLGIVKLPVNDTNVIVDADYRTGKCTVTDEHFDAFKEFSDPLEESYYEMADEKSSQTLTIGQLYRKDFRRFIQAHKDDKEIFTALSRFYISYYESEWAARISQLALQNFNQWDDFSQTNSGFALSGDGYKAILDYIVSGLPRRWFRLKARVINIDYRQEKTIIQLTSGVEEKRFDYVIVTVPLGHLKKYSHILFTPSLPRRKREAIDKLGFGDMQKLFLVYDTPFWPRNSSLIVPLRIAACNATPANKLTENFHTFEPMSSSKKILSAWLSGEAPTLLSLLSDKEVGRQVTEHFREMFQNESIPEPIRVMRKQWNTDDLFLGSYSYITPAAAALPESVYIRMATPVRFKGRLKLLFAGEATHRRVYQTTIGAYLSGRREAERISRLSLVNAQSTDAPTETTSSRRR